MANILRTSLGPKGKLNFDQTTVHVLVKMDEMCSVSSSTEGE